MWLTKRSDQGLEINVVGTGIDRLVSGGFGGGNSGVGVEVAAVSN
jgi:hypothetical protein